MHRAIALESIQMTKKRQAKSLPRICAMQTICIGDYFVDELSAYDV